MRRAVALFLALAMGPQVVGGQSDVRVLHPVADALVNEGKPGTNAGGDTTLRVRVKSRASYRSFLRFDLAGITGTVLSAKLRLFCTDASPDGGQLYSLADSGWSETGITWANQPVLPAAAFAALGPVSLSRWVEVDVTAALAGTPTGVFALAGGSSNSAYYSSREGSNSPELVLALSGGGPVAAFSGSPLSGAAPLMVGFTDLSSGAPTSWTWDFGDGGGSTEQHPAHLYERPGTYTVRLDVASASGSGSLTRTDYVIAQGPSHALTFLPTADARVNLASSTRNYGTDGVLRVRSGTDPYHTYLRFEPVGLAGPVTSALLRLFVTDESDVGGIVFATSSDWGETTLTWSNRPAPIGNALTSAGNAPAGAWVVFDVTAAVTGPGPVSFVIQSSSTNSCYFSSREGANPPQLVIESGAPLPPVAAFSATPLSGSAPLSVAFSDQSSGAPTSWAWDFGDGATSTVQHPAHRYDLPGTYSVRLDVTGPGGSDSLTRTDCVSVSPPPVPVADFGGTPLSGAASLTVSFTDLSSGAPTSWAWDFGDGTTSTAQHPAHRYDQPGTYSVRLDVTGPGGSGSLTRSDYVSVGPPPGPVAAFGGAPLSGAASLTVSFTDLSSGQVTDWLWQFGDGGSSLEQAPVHTYTDPGSYSVSLTVTGPWGTSTLTKEAFVRVFDANLHGIWTSAFELSALPMSGPAWDNVLAAANLATGTPVISNQDDSTDQRVLAKALVFARTGDQRYRQEVIDACRAAIGTEQGGRTLALGRNLVAYVASADLVGLPAEEDASFRAWLRVCLTEVLDTKTLISTHEIRPNNWGTAAGASRAAVALYLGDMAELERCAQVFRGWLGDRSSYAGFTYGDLSWQADPSGPVGINPLGSLRDGHSIDGVLPDDQRRTGGFVWPPPKENYVWTALQGALVQAVILHRAGYAVWEWQDQALLRAFRWLHEECNYPATGNDGWLPHIINHFYGTSFPAPVPAMPGTNMGWTDWTFSRP